MTFDEFSASRGVSPHPPQFPELHRAPGGVSGRSARAASEWLSLALAVWQGQRDQLRAEYARETATGGFRGPSRAERLALIAGGEGPAAEAARRLLEKAGGL